MNFSIYSLITMIYYLLLAHTQPKQVEKLCNVLEWNIYIHLDERQDKKDWQFISENKENIKFISERMKINWGWFSMIQWTINWLKEMSPLLKGDDHVIVISWQDYPLKNKFKINEYFNPLKWKSIIDVYDDKEWNKNLIKRYNWWYYRDLNIPQLIDNIFHFLWWIFFDVSNLKNPITVYIIERFLNLILPRRKYLINRFNIYWGSQRMVLSTKHIKYLLKYIETNEGKKVLKNYKRVLIPDETFFHTILMNSEYKDEIINKSLWYIDRETWPEYPRILRLEDYEKIEKSNKLFARKFNSTSLSLIEHINKTILS